MGKYLVLILKGMGYGITHVVPGLGGALVLILMGIYEQFVDAMGNLFTQRDRWKQHLSFLVPVGIGMVLGMIVLAKLISLVWGRFPAATQFFFMGMVVGTIPAVLQLHGDMRPTAGRIIALLGGIVLVVATRLIDGQNGARGTLDLTTAEGLVYNTIIAFLAGGASVTPGLDGSYVLLLGHTYEPFITALGNGFSLAMGLLRFQWDPQLWIILSTGLSALVGIFIFSKLIDTAIKHKPSVTYYAVLGLIAGSIYGLWPTMPDRTSVVILGLMFVIGAAVAFYFSRPQEAVVEESDAVLPS